jgi:hypothetical protein
MLIDILNNNIINIFYYYINNIIINIIIKNINIIINK